VYRDAFADFQEYLAKATGKKVVYYTVQSNAAEVEAMRSGRLHTPASPPAPPVRRHLAGYVPIAVKGYPDGFRATTLSCWSRRTAPYQTLTDLKGKKVAPTSPLVQLRQPRPARAVPQLGLVPDEDYTVLYSGKHDQSVLGVAHGDYDAAPVASTCTSACSRPAAWPRRTARHLHQPALPHLVLRLIQPALPRTGAKGRGAFHTYRFPSPCRSPSTGPTASTP
jgi:phosphonate transport system substrate-binding protein